MPKKDWQDFEDKVRIYLQKKFNCELTKGSLNIKGKNKSFDLLNKDRKIVGDIKHYRNTKSGSEPSAKRSILNEYVWILQKLPRRWRKIIVIGEDYNMAKKYIKDFYPWLNGVTFYYFDRKGKFEILKKG